MTIVVDANVIVVLVSGDPRRPLAQARLRGWIEAGEDLHAPELLPYEVASALTRLIAAGAFPSERLDETWRMAQAIPVTFHALQEHGDRIVSLALQLGRRSAYDAAYLALAQQLGADLWTFDGSLARNAAGLGLKVQLIT